jgi:hypothetical protein
MRLATMRQATMRLATMQLAALRDWPADRCPMTAGVAPMAVQKWFAAAGIDLYYYTIAVEFNDIVFHAMIVHGGHAAVRSHAGSVSNHVQQAVNEGVSSAAPHCRGTILLSTILCANGRMIVAYMYYLAVDNIG